MQNTTDAVKATYGSDRLAHSLLEQMRKAGYDMNALTTADLITFDELHIMGRQATIELGKLAGLDADMHIVDIGSGLGGPARTLAAEFGCHVTGVDLSQEFVNASTVLSERVGLAGKVDFKHGNALELPFDGECFDAAFMIHLNVNISAKQTMFNEARRVLKKGAKLALWEICRGEKEGFIYPVPWAQDASFSFLIPMDEMVDLLSASGFENLQVEDATDEAVEWVRARQTSKKKPGSRPPALDLDLVLDNFRQKRVNISKNLMQGCIRILRCIATRAGHI